MTIGMILDNEFTGDLRVENEVEALVKAGFKVKVLCFNHGKKKLNENYKGGEIIRISIKKWYKNKMKGLCNTFFDLYTPFWAKEIVQFVKNEEIDVLHIHDLYLLGATLKAKEAFPKTIPLVADLHENYPEALKYYKFSNTFPGNILISIKKWKKIEIEWLKQMDKIIVVVEEAKERISKLGISPNNIYCVENYVNIKAFNPGKIPKNKVNHSEIVITYIGGFDWHRGINTAIEAMPLLLKKNTLIRLNLVGTGSNIEELKNKCIALEIEKFVYFPGWTAVQKLPQIIHESTLCIIPHTKTGHTDNTMPHKLFQYMLLKKPVLCSNCKSLVRIVNETQSGEIFVSGNANDFAEKAFTMLSDPELLTQYAKNGYNAVITQYNWEEAAKSLVNLYQEL